jgi:hypothetical protein
MDFIMNFELGRWGDETVRLYYEDRINGEDICFALNESGKTYRVTVDQDGNETRIE